MDLNNPNSFSTLDTLDMLGFIDRLPDQLDNAWKLGGEQPLPDWTGFDNVLVAGMGGSAIGADLLAAYAEPLGKVPIYVHRDYDLPAWVTGENTLVICSSHSGNTEETLTTFKQAQERGCRIVSVTTGGQLSERAVQAGLPVWKFVHQGQPRSAVGFSFGLLLSIYARLGLMPDPSTELKGAVAAMKLQQESLRAGVLLDRNPAKRMAGQLMGRWVSVFAAGILAPVARRWKGQISEVAKAWAQFEYLPEADHNTLAGTENPENVLMQAVVLFLRAPSNHPRNLLRLDLTQKGMLVQGINTDLYEAKGETPMAHQWTCLHFGDYMAYYLAMLYEVDPTPVMALQNLKGELQRL
jgi:glucose/mannose-6-phosphate isomerase